MRQARRYPDAHQWATAHNAELDQLDSMNAFRWISPDYITGKHVLVGTIMNYRYKRDSGGKIKALKARCAIRGDRMRPNLHFDPEKVATFMADKSSIRLLLALAARDDLLIEHFDIKCAYLHELYQHRNPAYVYVSHGFLMAQ